jgi:hypothetical protein
MQKIPDINFLPEKLKNKNLFKKITASINPKIYPTIALILLGAISLGAIQNRNEVSEIISKPITSRALASSGDNSLGPVIFGSLDAAQTQEATAMLEKQTRLITKLPSFFPALSVVQKHAATIKHEADKAGVPEDVAIGISFLENGGSEYAVSSAGARGIYQFMPSTARGYGLVVNASQDDRVDPEKSTKAAMQYLKNNYALLKDWGLTIWSYHAGAGNVCKALRVYAKANQNLDLGSCDNSMGDYVVKYGITINKIMSDPTVRDQVTSKLQDDSSGYAYKVMTTAYIYNLSEKLSSQELSQRVNDLTSKVTNVQQFFNS